MRKYIDRRACGARARARAVFVVTINADVSWQQYITTCNINSSSIVRRNTVAAAAAAAATALTTAAQWPAIDEAASR